MNQIKFEWEDNLSLDIKMKMSFIKTNYHYIRTFVQFLKIGHNLKNHSPSVNIFVTPTAHIFLSTWPLIF